MKYSVLAFWAIVLPIMMSGCTYPKEWRGGCQTDPVKLSPVHRTRTVLVMCDDGIMKYVEAPIEELR